MGRALVIAAATTATAGVAVRSRRVVNGLQVLIAKGRKKQNRGGLVGNWAPVKDEVFEEDCEVVGQLPRELDGMYMRNGSNPFFNPYASYHVFEGDGMVHATRIRGGKAAYSNRFVRTHKLAEEQRVGFPIYAKFGDQEGVRGLFVALLEMLKEKTGIIRGADLLKSGKGTANTSLVYHAGRLLALHEGDLPYQLKVMCEGVVETVGRMRVGDWSVPFTAHPRLDAATGNLHIIGYNIDKQPYLTYGVLSPNGSLLKSFPIEVPFPTMFHDFCITENYAVFMHMPLCFDPKAMVERNSLPLVFKPELRSRIGLLPLTATSGDEVTWYELPSFYTFHFANAWETPEGQVKMFGCQIQNFNMAAQEFSEEMGAKMTCYTVDPKAGSATLQKMSDVAGDFCLTHPAMQGRPSRWAWMGVTDTKDKQGQFKGIAKLDLTTPPGSGEAAVAVIDYGAQGLVGGEAFFVPRHAQPAACDGEDDGFVLVYVTEAPPGSTAPPGVSWLHVYDAKTMAQQPLARVKLPQRVPHGFHSTWITAEQIRSQVLPGLSLG